MKQLGKLEDLLDQYNVKDLEELDKLLEMATSYEELSKQICCPLEVLFKLVNQNELYFQFYNELQHWTSIKVDLRKRGVWFCKQVGGSLCLQSAFIELWKNILVKRG